MSSCRRFLAPVAGAVLFVLFAPVTDAAAQMAWGDRVFVNGSIGQQKQSQTLSTSGSFPIYEETASWSSTLEVDDSTIIDLAAGFRVWKNLALGVGFTSTTDSHDTTLEASIPDTLLFSNPHASSVPVTGLDRSEKAFHISATWIVPVTDKLDIALSGGPSFFTVEQPYVSGMTVTSGGVTVASVEQSSVKESAVGYHVGIDGTFLITRINRVGIGIGAMARLSSAKVDAPVFGEIDAGGFQGGVGLRLRF